MASFTLPQESIAVKVAFYDDEEKKKLLLYPTGKEMEQIAAQPIIVPTAEFLTYYLFYRKRLGTPGYRDYFTIGKKIHNAIADLDECLDFNGQSICTSAKALHQLPHISEHVGEAIGLSVINRIHNLTDADWIPIKEFHGRKAPRTFDFEIASDGQKFIQVENKGCSVDNNDILSNNVKAQKRKIIEKKENLKTHQDPFPANLRYGTITVIDRRIDNPIKCLLTDPEADSLLGNPYAFRLISRMKFLLDWISFLSPRSQLTSALATRITDLENTTDPLELNNIPLLRRGNEPFNFYPLYDQSPHSTFFSNKSRILDGPAGGIVVQFSGDSLFLIGIQEDLINIAIKQNFEEISTYKTRAGTIQKIVECNFSKRRFHLLDIPDFFMEQIKPEDNYISFHLEGKIHYSSSGLVFGILPLLSENLNEKMN